MVAKDGWEWKTGNKNTEKDANHVDKVFISYYVTC